jgi:hypothetical protein
VRTPSVPFLYHLSHADLAATLSLPSSDSCASQCFLQEKKEQLKKEGKLLTGKQKEEARRLAAVREQMLKQAGVKIDEGDEAAPKKQKVSYCTARWLVFSV